MSDRVNRFVASKRFDCFEDLPKKLLELFQAKDVHDMMKIAANFSTDLKALKREAHEHMGLKAIRECMKAAVNQTKLPAECAFALNAYTRNDVFKDLNKLLRYNKDLQEYRNLCVCLVKAQ